MTVYLTEKTAAELITCSNRQTMKTSNVKHTKREIHSHTPNKREKEATKCLKLRFIEVSFRIGQ